MKHMWCKLLLLFALLSAQRLLVVKGAVFNYTITANGTETTTNYPSQTFIWTVTATADETWYTDTILTASVSKTSEGYPSAPGFEAEALVSGVTKFEFLLESTGISGGGYANAEVRLYVNGKIKYSFCACQPSESQPGSQEFVANAGDHYRVSFNTGNQGPAPSFIKSRATATLTYPHRSERVANTARRSATDSGHGTVEKPNGRKFIRSFSAMPTTGSGGSLGAVSNSVTDDSADVSVWLEGNAVFAETRAEHVQTKSWSRTTSGSSSVSPNEDNKFIVATSLIAPNRDTEWSVVDDSDEVDTRMEANNLFAWVSERASQALEIEVAAVRLKWLTVPNQIYKVQWSSALQGWTELTSIVGNGTVMTVVDAVSSERRFYRLIRE